jgi:hypothetical protein
MMPCGVARSADWLHDDERIVLSGMENGGAQSRPHAVGYQLKSPSNWCDEVYWLVKIDIDATMTGVTVPPNGEPRTEPTQLWNRAGEPQSVVVRKRNGWIWEEAPYSSRRPPWLIWPGVSAAVRARLNKPSDAGRILTKVKTYVIVPSVRCITCRLVTDEDVARQDPGGLDLQPA